MTSGLETECMTGANVLTGWMPFLTQTTESIHGLTSSGMDITLFMLALQL